MKNIKARSLDAPKYSRRISAYTLILTLALSLLYINTYTSTVSALTLTH